MSRQPRMIISTEGQEASGKTFFALNGTPRPLTLLDFDWGSEGLPEHLLAGITHKTYDVMEGSFWGLGPSESTKKVTEEMQRFLADFRTAIKDQVRTLVVDTFTTAWKSQRIARENDKYAIMEEEFKALVRAAYVSPYTNLILIHHMRVVWGQGKDGRRYPSGAYDRDGMDGIGAMVQLGIKQRFVPPVKVGNLDTPGRFEMDVYKSRDNPAFMGMTLNPAMDFVTLCSMVAPSIDWSK